MATIHSNTTNNEEHCSFINSSSYDGILYYVCLWLTCSIVYLRSVITYRLNVLVPGNRKNLRIALNGMATNYPV